MKINEAVLPDPQTTPVQSSLLSDALQWNLLGRGAPFLGN